MKTNYPWQINSVIHKSKTATKTLGMDAMLFSPKEEDEVRTPAAPLEMHEGYSVFKGTLIVKESKNTDVLKFNIPAKAVPYIHKRTSMAIDMNMKNQLISPITGMIKASASASGSEDVSGSIAFTVSFMTGTLKGKTPGQMLLDSPANREVLLKQRKFLETNVARYPANQSQIDAIDEAIKLLDAGKLIKTEEMKEVSAPGVITIYECAPKNVKPIDEEGRWTIYQVSITYNPAMSLPFDITVMNCFAPVNKSKGNEIEMSKAIGKMTKDIRLSEEEWYTMIDTMKATKIMFENLTYPEQLKLASKISRENYESAKAAAEPLS